MASNIQFYTMMKPHFKGKAASTNSPYMLLHSKVRMVPNVWFVAL